MFRLEKLEISGFKSFADRTTVVFGEGITAIVGPNGCGKCVDGNTLVTLADGRDVPIRELVEAALSDSQRVETLDDGSMTRENPHGIVILSLNPETLRLEPRPVAAFIKRETTPRLLRIRTRAGRQVTATPYHPLFTLKGGSLHALKAEELRVGARIALPRRLPVSGGGADLSPLAVIEKFQAGDKVYVPNSEALQGWADAARAKFGTWAEWVRAADVPFTQFHGLLIDQAISTAVLVKLAQAAEIPPPLDGQLKSHGRGQIRLPFTVTPDLARFLGLLIAEGRNTVSNQVWFVNADPAINDEYARLARKLFGVQVQRSHYKKTTVAEDSLIYSRTLGVALERLFNFPINSSSAEKEIPPQLFESSAETQWAFLSGLFEGDAYLSVRQDENRSTVFIEYVSASRKLAEQVVALLLRLGVFAVLRPKQRYASNTEAKRRRTYYSVYIYGTESLRYAAQHLSFVGEKRHALETLKNLPAASNPNHDLVPGVTSVVKDAVRLAGVRIKANRPRIPNLAAYVENRCEASRGGLLEVIGQIEGLGASPESARAHLDRLSVLATSDVYWDEIVSIEEVEPADGWVYDLSIAETHNFVAGNIIVHNSNVAESISWVLGEQSAKNLRGGKMEDVIFNGTRDRKPTGMAEVTLTLVAIEDITAQDSEEQEKNDEAEYEGALANAEHAATAARALVAEMTRTEEDAGSQSAPEGVQAQEGQQPAPENARPIAEKRAPRRQKRKKVAVSAGERITVGRRLYRTGDSDYLMNGRPCLLRDIQDLFAGTGLGGAHYAIIEQGRIGQILSSKPLDRRALIEEAAGITKFKSRKRATELKLESAKQNLTRLNDIISEVERQVNSLKRQAQKARRYRRLREELRAIQKTVFTADYHRLTEAHGRVLAELAEAERQRQELVALVAEREGEHHVVSAAAREAEDNLTALREKAAAIQLEADRARNRRAFDEQQINELTARITEIERDQKTLEERLVSLELEAGKRAADLKALEQELAAEQADLFKREGRYQQELTQLRQAEAEIEQLRQRMLTEIGNFERLRNVSASLEDGLRRLDLKQANLRSEMERAQARLQEAEGEYERVGNEAEGNRARLAELSRKIAERAAALEATRNETTDLRSQLEGKRVERAAAAHRLASLEDLDKHHAYYSDAVQQVLSPEHAARINAIGTLADFVEVEAQYERLIESLFSRELQCVLVPTIDDALAGLDYLKSSDLGRGAFLVVGLHGAEGEPDDRGQGSEIRDQGTEEPTPDPRPLAPAPCFQLDALRALDLLGLRPEIRSVVERAFPDKCAALVTPDIEAALHLSIENPARVYVTMAGEQVVNGRLMVSGAPAGQQGTSLLALKREIKELQAQTQALRGEEERLTAALADATRRLQEIESEAQGLDLEARQQERAAAAHDSQLEALARDRERARQHVRVVESEQEITAQERAELQARLESLSVELRGAEASRHAVQEAVAQAQAAFVDMRARVEEFAEQLSAARAQAAARAERLQAAKAEARRMENEAEELRSRINRNRLELYESHNRIEQLSASLSEGDSATAQFDQSSAELARQIGAATEALAASRARVDELEAALREMRQAQAEAHDRRSRLEVERTRIESDAEHLTRTCFAELAMRLEDVVQAVVSSQGPGVREDLQPIGSDEGDVQSAGQSDEDQLTPGPWPLTTDVEAARARMDELRVKLDDMGPVNMMALEELEESEQRFQFLSEQRRDILDSIRLTEEALAEIKRRSRERFRHAFTHINQNFQQMFMELFGGGRGEMVLIDEQDILESGIDLIAQPPGKRLQNVLLLSGGEKAMAAIALVLAIFQYRPSPFCILDEVDAPLDEMNVGRFSDKVIEMSKDTQFLVITHNKRTMEAARALYGVTMEEPGVSKLVSVKFE